MVCKHILIVRIVDFDKGKVQKIDDLSCYRRLDCVASQKDNDFQLHGFVIVEIFRTMFRAHSKR